MASSSLDVHIELNGKTYHVGQPWFTQRRGGPVSTVFAYSAHYLMSRHSTAVDPGLPLVSGNQYVDGLPGAFQDCSPDRWGRNLIDKRARLDAAGGAQPGFNEVDYLTRVTDRTRQGALRFTEPGDSVFVDPADRVPKLIELPRLLNASDVVSAGSDDLAAVKALLDAGSGSLGGARPKASVVDTEGRLHLAKFPHHGDEWDVMAWECVALDLVALAEVCRLDDTQAHGIRNAVAAVADTLGSIAHRRGLAPAEIARFADVVVDVRP